MRLRQNDLIFSAIFTLLFFLPIIFLITEAFSFHGNYLIFLLIKRAIMQSILQASLSTLISLAIGLILTILLVVYNGRLLNVIIAVMYISYVMPGIIIALSIIFTFGFENPFMEIILGNVIFNAPMIGILGYLYAMGMNQKEIQMAKILGASDFQLIKLYLRNGMKGLWIGAILTFILCFQGFSLPLIIGGPRYSTFEVLIYLFKRTYIMPGPYPFSNASMMAILQFSILLFPVVSYLIISRLPSISQPQNFKAFSRGKSLIALLLLALILFILYFPIIFLFLHNPFWEMFSLLNTYTVRLALLNTILFSSISILSSLLLLIFVFSDISGYKSQLIFITSTALTPVAIALSYFLIYQSILPLPYIIVLIFIAISLPFMARNYSDSILRIPFSERNSPFILGDSRIGASIFYYLGRIKSSFIGIVALEFVTVMGEFSAIATVYTQNTVTLTVEIYNEFLLRKIGIAYAISELFVTVIFISTFLIYMIGISGKSGSKNLYTRNKQTV